MQIIQNLACVEIVVNESDNIIVLKKDILEGKKVNAVYLFGSTEDKTILSPFTDENIAQVGELDDLNLFMNLFDVNHNPVVKDLSLQNFLIDTESTKHFEYDINRLIDVKKMFLNCKSANITDARMLVYFLYQSENYRPTADDINGSVSYNIIADNEIQDIKLKDIIGYTLNDKPVREIQVNSNATTGYLELRSKNGKRFIENIPLSLLSINSPSNFTIDPFIIDVDTSYLHIRSMDKNNQIQLTFIY